jgi:lipoprotein-releasing system ATP-binding protein
MSEAPNNVIVEARGVSKDYHDGTRVLSVLNNLDLTVRPGEIISVVGVSGAGKSTLLHLLGAIDRPSEGSVTLTGRDLAAADDRELARIRAQSVGFIFQFHHLLAEFTALENVLIPGLILGQPRAKLEPRAREVLGSLGLSERVTHRPSQLSGGEQQRVALARALMNHPDLILADEPTGNLDASTAETVIDLLWSNARQNAKALIIVTHEPSIAKRADRCLRLRDGRLVEEDSGA